MWVLWEVSGSTVQRCLNNNWCKLAATRMCEVWLSGSSSLPGLCAPSQLPSLQHCSFVITPLCHAAGLELTQLLAGVAASEPGPASWQSVWAEGLEDGISLVAPCFWGFPVNPSLQADLAERLHVCAGGTFPLFTLGVAALHVPSCSSCFISLLQSTHHPPGPKNLWHLVRMLPTLVHSS